MLDPLLSFWVYLAFLLGCLAGICLGWFCRGERVRYIDREKVVTRYVVGRP